MTSPGYTHSKSSKINFFSDRESFRLILMMPADDWLLIRKLKTLLLSTVLNKFQSVPNKLIASECCANILECRSAKDCEILSRSLWFYAHMWNYLNLEKSGLIRDFEFFFNSGQCWSLHSSNILHHLHIFDHASSQPIFVFLPSLPLLMPVATFVAYL